MVWCHCYYHPVQEDERQEEEKLLSEFKSLTQNLHHLLSTTTIPGVYHGEQVRRQETKDGKAGLGLEVPWWL